MLFGGQKESTVQDLSTPANKNANRLRLVWNPAVQVAGHRCCACMLAAGNGPRIQLRHLP